MVFHFVPFVRRNEITQPPSASTNAQTYEAFKNDWSLLSWPLHLFSQATTKKKDDQAKEECVYKYETEITCVFVLIHTKL